MKTIKGMTHLSESGFTLIEMSIVLVVIGLIVGGVLVGQDLIRAAYVRAQISQIEKFNTAVNTFYGKYQALPGDMNATTAAQFGFATRSGAAGQGDSNGLLEGWYFGDAFGQYESAGETQMFWSDITYANGQNINLIEGSYPQGSFTVEGNVSGTALNGFIPTAKIGRGNYIYVWSGGTMAQYGGGDGHNYFGLSEVNYEGAGYEMFSTPGLTVSEAYRIDSKTDDGLPQSGRVIAVFVDTGNNGYPNNAVVYATWAAGIAGPYAGASSLYNGAGGPTTNPTPGTVNTCYDNNSTNGASQTYSMEINGGAGLNCALSFMMQGGD